MTLQIDHPVPSFTAISTIGQISSENLLGKTIVLYFYPKDNTPGCTVESQDFRDLHVEFLQANAIVIGVSRDSLKSHGNFQEKFNLPFALISDPQETLCELFGVMKIKNMYGKQARGIERSTFVIDQAGVLRQEWRGVKVPGHVQSVLKMVQSLKNS